MGALGQTAKRRKRRARAWLQCYSVRLTRPTETRRSFRALAPAARATHTQVLVPARFLHVDPTGDRQRRHFAPRSLHSSPATMNSYPAELTHHVYASMFVAGLLKAGGAAAAAAAASTSTSQADTAGPSSEQSQSTPVADSTSAPLVTHPRDRYPDLCAQLAELLSARGRNTIWDPARGRSAVFHSVLVDHNVRLPPRKTRSSSKSVASDTDAAAESLASLPSRSPLSPLHPSSPLFPDGLIAPIWVRKHRDLVPAVFVAFHCLAPPYIEDETQDPSTTSDDGAKTRHVNGNSAPDQPKSQRSLTGAELKARDEELVRLIADRKRSLAERGIKLTVVLLTDRDMLGQSAG